MDIWANCVQADSQTFPTHPIIQIEWQSKESPNSFCSNGELELWEPVEEGIEEVEPIDDGREGSDFEDNDAPEMPEAETNSSAICQS